MVFEISSVVSKLQMLSTSDHSSVVSMNLFVALLCGCIVLGHLLEENRWMNESITALLIVSLHYPGAYLPPRYLKVSVKFVSPIINIAFPFSPFVENYIFRSLRVKMSTKWSLLFVNVTTTIDLVSVLIIFLLFCLLMKNIYIWIGFQRENGPCIKHIFLYLVPVGKIFYHLYIVNRC